VHGLEVEYYGKVNFVYLDIDNSTNDDFKRQLGYRVQPNLFLLDGEGNIIQQWLGVVTAEELRAAFDSVVQ
jgi:thioredoxin-like negative regulator of GroEL